MYGNSGNFWGIIIGIIAGAIIIFLITREFWCWYWKINRLVALMEEQNDLLRQQLGISSHKETNIRIPSSTETNIEIPSSGKVYKAITDTAIKDSPNHDAFPIKVLNIGDMVYFQYLSKDDPAWYYVKSFDSKNEGWCFSGHLGEC